MKYYLFITQIENLTTKPFTNEHEKLGLENKTTERLDRLDGSDRSCGVLELGTWLLLEENTIQFTGL